jgi:hypothetical protein
LKHVSVLSLVRKLSPCDWVKPLRFKVVFDKA